jgi:hypothetical protein
MLCRKPSPGLTFYFIIWFLHSVHMISILQVSRCTLKSHEDQSFSATTHSRPKLFRFTRAAALRRIQDSWQRPDGQRVVASNVRCRIPGTSLKSPVSCVGVAYARCGVLLHRPLLTCRQILLFSSFATRPYSSLPLHCSLPLTSLHCRSTCTVHWGYCRGIVPISFHGVLLSIKPCF